MPLHQLSFKTFLRVNLMNWNNPSLHQQLIKHIQGFFNGEKSQIQLGLMEAVVAHHSLKMCFMWVFLRKRQDLAIIGQKPLRIELANIIFSVRKEPPKAVNFN